MDLVRKGITPRIYGMQGDKDTRIIELVFREQGAPWHIPLEATAIIGFCKPDGSGGNYDTLPDDSQACKTSGNIATVTLVKQVFECPGDVHVVVRLISEAKEISAFPITVCVQPNPGLKVFSDSYYKIAGSLPDSGWSPNKLLGTDASGNVVAKEAVHTTGESTTDVMSQKAVTDAIDTLEAAKLDKSDANNIFASAINIEAKGKAISVNDVSSLAHKVKCKVDGINLASVSDFSFIEASPLIKLRSTVPAGTKITISCDIVTQSSASVIFQLRGDDDGKGLSGAGYINKATDSNRKYFTTTVPAGWKKWRLYIGDSVNQVEIKNFMIEVGNTPTNFEPYVSDLSKVRVTRCGKNMFDINRANEIVNKSNRFWFMLKPNTKYTVSTNMPKFTTTASVYVNGGSSVNNGCSVENPITVTTGANGRLYIDLRNVSIDDETYDAYNLIKTGGAWLQLEEGSAPTDYEPYEGSDFTTSPDGSVSGMAALSPDMSIFTGSSNVIVDITYNADTKKYIDGKFAELQNAIIAQGGK